jgi:hypothetical protein
MNKWVCPAKFSNTGDTTLAANSNIETYTATPWWCSDGTFNILPKTTHGLSANTAAHSFGLNGEADGS